MIQMKSYNHFHKFLMKNTQNSFSFNFDYYFLHFYLLID